MCWGADLPHQCSLSLNPYLQWLCLQPSATEVCLPLTWSWSRTGSLGCPWGLGVCVCVRPLAYTMRHWAPLLVFALLTTEFLLTVHLNLTLIFPVAGLHSPPGQLYSWVVHRFLLCYILPYLHTWLPGNTPCSHMFPCMYVGRNITCFHSSIHLKTTYAVQYLWCRV